MSANSRALAEPAASSSAADAAAKQANFFIKKYPL
jgi:hypothetical protein